MSTSFVHVSTNVHINCPRVHKCPLHLSTCPKVSTPFVHVSTNVYSICPRVYKCPLHLSTYPYVSPPFVHVSTSVQSICPRFPQVCNPFVHVSTRVHIICPSFPQVSNPFAHVSTSVHSICPRVHKCPLPFVHVSKSVHSICPRDHKCPLHLCTCPGAERQDGGPTVGTAAVRAGKDPQGDWIVSYIVFLFFFQLVFAYLWAQSKTDFAIKIPTIRYVPKNVALVEKISPPARQARPCKRPNARPEQAVKALRHPPPSLGIFSRCPLPVATPCLLNKFLVILFCAGNFLDGRGGVRCIAAE